MPPASAEDSGILAGTPEFRRTNIAVFSCGFSIFAILYCPQPVLPQLVQEFGVTPATSSLAVSLTAIVMAVAMLFASSLSEVVGRKALMLGALVGSSVLTLALYIAPSWDSILILRALAGLALSGAPAVTLAYLGEEMAPRAVAPAVGLYIGGSALGGMAGRLVAAWLADFGSWRLAMAGLGVLGLVSAGVFWRSLPPSRHFRPRQLHMGHLALSMLRLLRNPAIVLLVVAGFFLLGSFMTLYNYMGFRLQAPPFNMSQAVAGSVFVIYPIGSFGSAWLGALAARRGRGPVMIATVLMMLAGLLLMTPDSLIFIAIGMVLLTFSFFGAHAICSGWAPAATPNDKAQASSLYLLLYYIGGGIAGTVGGVFWTAHGWTGVALFCGAMMLGTLFSAIALMRNERRAR
jgi:YNFM family putative membrane transporter